MPGIPSEVGVLVFSAMNLPALTSAAGRNTSAAPTSHPTDGRDRRKTLIDVPRCCTAGYLGGLVDSEKVRAAEQLLNANADFEMALCA